MPDTIASASALVVALAWCASCHPGVVHTDVGPVSHDDAAWTDRAQPLDAAGDGGVADRLAPDGAADDLGTGDALPPDAPVSDASLSDSPPSDATPADTPDAHGDVTCDPNALTGYYCAGDKVSGGAVGTLYFCDGPGPARLEEVCAHGCVIAPAGQDDHCAADDASCDASASTGYYCAGDKVSGGVTGTLYYCNGPGVASVAEVCANGCVVAPAGQDDHCATASATCDADAVTGDYCAGDKVSNGVADTLYHCTGPGPATVVEACAHGCFVAPAGQDDYCAAAAASCDANAATGYYCAGDKVSNGVSGTLYFCTGPGPATVAQLCTSGCVVAPAGQDDYCAGGGGSDYRLPYACGTAYRCSSGNHTSNHSGMDEYAYDFAMPSGTSVKAIRGGVVHRVRIVSEPGDACYDGGGSTCANLANTVELRHGDGSISLYMHINRATVSTGQNVSQGQEIARSGNTGWSTGPHLHLQLQANCGIWWCQSRDFDFVEDSNLVTGETVSSQNCP